MAYQTAAVIDAMQQLADMRRMAAQDDGPLYALAWLAGARMVQRDMLPEGARISSLTDPATWLAAHSVIGKMCVEIIWGKGTPTQNTDLDVSRAAGIVAQLLDRAPDFFLSVPDALWHLPTTRGADLFGLAPEACDLLFSLLGAPRGAKVWIPFDPVGQLASRALRLGYSLELAGPLAWATDVQRLCRAVLGIFEDDQIQAADGSRLPDGKRDFQVDYLIAVPPVGGRIQPGMGWHQWEGTDEVLSQNRMLVHKLGPMTQLRLDRMDTWAPAALWPRVQRRAVFMTAQSLLFARGQEQRLREAWVRDHYGINTILALPGRLHSHTSIAPAALLFDREASGYELRMGDLSEFTVRTGVGSRSAKTLDLQRTLDALDLRDPFAQDRNIDELHMGAIDRYSSKTDERAVRRVPFKELMNEDCNLQPTRYLRPRLKLSGDRVPLRDLVEVIRAPVPTDDPYSAAAIEVGIPDLGSWRPVKPAPPAPDNQVRLVQLRERRREESSLKQGDIVMSIKGTVGKTALIGQSTVRAIGGNAGDETWSLVTSGNCIALRPRSDEITSEFLLLYFRSKEFEHQRDALLVGSVIPHVTPSALCDSVQIPVPSPAERARMMEKYQCLCDLEAQAEAANLRIAEIVRELWQPEL